MFNYYYDLSHPLRPFTHSLQSNPYSEQPFDAVRIEPTFKQGFHPCEKNGKWVQIIDHRGSKIYNTETKDCEVVKDIGDIPTGYTLLTPNKYDNWDGKMWIHNQELENIEIIKGNTLKKNELLTNVAQVIDILNDSIELGMATDEDKKELNNWKKYRVILYSVDVNDPEVIFPANPSGE